MIATTPKPPYFAVIFSSIRTEGENGYSEMAYRILELAFVQEGYLGYESARDDLGITVSYWDSLDSIKKWKENAEHRMAQKSGRDSWYSAFKVRIAKVEMDYDFSKL